MNNSVKEKYFFSNSSQNKGLSPSCIALSFNGFGSISWHSIWFFFGSYTVFTTFYGFPTLYFPDDFPGSKLHVYKDLSYVI
jgi:hypothetical protein